MAVALLSRRHDIMHTVASPGRQRVNGIYRNNDTQLPWEVVAGAHAQVSIAFHIWMNNGTYFDDVQVNAIG